MKIKTAVILLGSLSSALRPAGLFAFEWRKVANAAFAAGERIHYQINFGGMPGGTGEQSVLGTERILNRDALHIIFKAQTNKTFDVFHKIREAHESWLDTESLCSLKFVETVREGGYRKETVTTTDPATGRLNHTYKTTKHEGTHSEVTPPYLQDPISVVYFLRTQNLKAGGEFDILTHTGGETYHTKVKVKGVEKISVPAGTFECFHIVPNVEGKEKAKGSVEVWLTADDRRVPVLIKTKLGVGSFVAKMTGYAKGGERPAR